MLDQIKKLCKAYGITPQRSKGQHFLMDATVIDTMVETARLDQRDTVLEVGPGLGILTEALVARAGRVVSVELDRKLFGLLQAKFIVSRNLELVNDDILRCDFAGRLGAGYKVVANLPYNITSRFLKNILTAAVKPLVAVVLVQKEVAERICAKPGDLSLLGISVQLYGRPAVVATVGRQQFWPMPAVDSAIVAIRDIQPAAAIAARLKPVTEKQFWQLVRIGFSAKRKKLVNNLAAGLKVSGTIIETAAAEAGLTPNVRAQNLAVADWQQLAKKLVMYLN
ncbi:MAG: ribosomal RNA small subunit methyltransferase A [Candidatus Buchananbacteria bacterium RIFCSPHIGHO2_02_FULL_56_16]|uniref:Ribosomal RNA small subunit methyltransferase A n=1 Tax=Candidatus Buchananbacteria bacterium RIFCSPHIGHO2_02_FULL_56_16 TaxID=1797542 RepID=A0A1G1YHE5_9BACT|nr:MAG: ribosomal RNA small subunit methyltransferase A [Candidatus Buchananbacteria bacterium RIFCSPHIGHO2_02_FULL_56_16]